MSWLWRSWDEFDSTTHPVALQRGAFNLARRNTRLESAGRLLTSVAKLTSAIHDLKVLGFALEDAHLGKAPTGLETAHRHVEEAVYAGEELLLYHKRLALSEASYGFLHAHELFEQWDRYIGTMRITHEIYQFIIDCRELIDGYHQMARADERFMLEDIELPENLGADFRTARNLFSVGFDEIGLLIAGRGLEGVLRRVAKDRRILIQTAKGSPKNASEVDFADLIEVIGRVRWKTRDVPLVSRETKTLLHYLRTIRNSQAHPQEEGDRSRTARETARLTAVTANSIWNETSTSRARLHPTTVMKDW